MGVERGPTVEPERVSIKRQGVIGTKDETAGASAADEVKTPPAPSTTARAAPTVTHRERTKDLPETATMSLPNRSPTPAVS
jgi:hypothetical protein